MTRQEEKELIKQLKAAKDAYHKKFAPTPEEREKSQARVMAYITEHGGQPARKLTFAGRIGFTLRFARYLVPPQLAYSFAVLLLFVAGGALAVVSRNALPGERLYPAKLAIEKTQVRFVSNPSERAKAQMNIAGNRLREVRAITERAGESDGKVEKALNHFVQDVQGARENLKQAGDPVQVRAATSELARRAAQYKQELEQTKVILEQKERAVAPASAPAVSTPMPASPAGSAPVTPTRPALPEPLPEPDQEIEPQSTQFVVTPIQSRPRSVGFAALEKAERALEEVQEPIVDKP